MGTPKSSNPGHHPGNTPGERTAQPAGVSPAPLQWTITALIFSGRTDPHWPALRTTMNEALRLWDQLPAAPSAAPSTPPPLGYRGVTLRDPAGRTWTASSGTVTLRDPADAPSASPQTRRDDARSFEKLLLDSAPPGILPAGLNL